MENTRKTFHALASSKTKNKVKEGKNLNLDSSDDSDIIETESLTDREFILNSENQSEAEKARNSLNATKDKSENEAKESEQETPNIKRRQTKLPKEEVTLFRNLYSMLGRKQQKTKIKKPLKTTGI